MMKFYIIIVLVVFSFVSCNSQSNNQIKTAQFETLIKADSINILDVRTTEEFNTGHIEKSLHADWLNKTEFDRRTSFIDKDKPLYIYCLSGARSTAAGKYLRKAGYKNVIELQGGITAWNANGKKLVGNVSSNKEMDLTEFKIEIADKIVLVDVGATWCPPCQKMKPIIDKLVKNYFDKFALVNIDGGQDKKICAELKVEKLPVFIVYKNGVQVFRKDGIATELELKNALEIK